MYTYVREPAIAYGKQKFTTEEYLEMENVAIEKHEFYKGGIFGMSPIKVQHNQVSGNLVATLHLKQKGKTGRFFSSNQRVHIESKSLFTYPDISIICGKEISLSDDEWNLLNPTVIIEILPPSTKITTATKSSCYIVIYRRSGNTY